MPTASEWIAGGPVDGGAAVPSGYASRRSRVARRLQKLGLVGLQLLGLWAFNVVGASAVSASGLPIPGNLVGMGALYALLALGIVKVSWFEPAGSLLIRHLAFFFVPITVGLMDMGALFATRGIGIIVTLAVSAGIGVMLAGWVSQLLLREPEQPVGRS